MSWLFNALKWVKEFKRVYRGHKVKMYIGDDSLTHVTIDVAIDVPPERANAILKGLDDFIKSLVSKKPVGVIAEKIEEVKEEAELARGLVKQKKKRVNPLHVGVV